MCIRDSDFELKSPLIYTLDSVPFNILFKLNQIKNYTLSGTISKNLEFAKVSVSVDQYAGSFKSVMEELNYGNTFLINLTFPTEIITNYNLRELFNVSHAKYKLYFKDEFIVSSPESFIQIVEDKIKTFPMKGTIDASIKNAGNIILHDPKETAEHYTIVDLLRNDLSMVADNVRAVSYTHLTLPTSI